MRQKFIFIDGIANRMERGQGPEITVKFTETGCGSGTNLDYIGTRPLDEIVGVPVKVLMTRDGHFSYGARTLSGEVIADLTSKLEGYDKTKARKMLYGT